MKPITAVALVASLVSSTLAGDDGSPWNQFDFWLGEWTVNNRHIQPDASWRDTGTSRARITPVLGGRAVFEEWSGELEGRGRVIGMSLRAWDPSREKWRLLLNWPGGSSSFGILEGTFRHGRGEFLAGGGGRWTRYTFSDALADSVRWDSARTTDGGRSWSTDWIMEFSRSAPAATDDRALFEVAWDEERTAPETCRELDYLIGSWAGVVTDPATGTERAATFRAAGILRGWVTVSSLAIEGAPEDEQFAVHGLSTARGAWETWSLTAADTRLRRALGEARLGEATFVEELPTGALRTTYVLTGENRLSIERAVREDGEWRLDRSALLDRR